MYSKQVIKLAIVIFVEDKIAPYQFSDTPLVFWAGRKDITNEPGEKNEIIVGV
jgi:hypothetical protein